MAEKTAKTEQHDVEIVLGHDFQKLMLFNRFSIVAEADFKVLHFGFVHTGNLLIDHYVCAVHAGAIAQHRKANMEYLGRLGDLKMPGPERWDPPAARIPTQLFNHFALARHATEGEISLFNFSLKSLIDIAGHGKLEKKLLAQAVALLRSDVDVHKHFVAALYQ